MSKWKSMLRQQPNGQECQTLTKPPPTSRPVAKQLSVKRASFQDKYVESKTILGDSDSRNVFLATRKTDGVCVAVKRFDRQYTLDSEEGHLRKVKLEYRLGSQLRHHNIIQNIELFEDKGGQWLQVMEYAPFNLFDRVPAMLQEEIDCTFSQVAAGVRYIHQAGLAHRDLKLENIVHTQTGEMKIIDFGVATVCSVSDEPIRMSRDMVGCRPYMAPEIIERNPYNPQASDIWALAILYCCMVLKRFPWKEASMADRKFMDFIRSVSRDPAIQEDQQQSYGISLEKSEAICVIVTEEPVSETRRARSLWLPAQKFSEESWVVVREMLRVSPIRRPTMKQIMNSSWVNTNRPCSVLGNAEKSGPFSHSHGS